MDEIISSEPRLMSTFRLHGCHLLRLNPMGVKVALLATNSAKKSTIPNRQHKLSHFGIKNIDSKPSTQSNDRDSASTSKPASRDDEGEVEPDTHGEDQIPENHKVSLPFWSAKSLAERNVVTVRLPHGFQTKYRHALCADVSSVPLY